MIKQDYEPELTREPQRLLEGTIGIWYCILITIISACIFSLAVHGFWRGL